MKYNNIAILIIIIIICLIYLLYNNKYKKFNNKNDWDKNTEIIIVSSHWEEKLDWLLNSPVPVIVCGHEGEEEAAIKSNPKCTTINEGCEASSFLKFIIEYYDTLPQYTMFIHGHEDSWHQSKNLLEILNERKWVNKSYYSINDNKYFCGPGDKKGVIEPKFAVLWDKYFRKYLKRDPPTDILSQCCAQFVISRNTILKHPKEAYKLWLKLSIEDFKLYNDITPNSKSMAGVFEFLWHIIFGEPDEIFDQQT